MMALLYLLISAAIGVVLCESDICSRRPYEECRYNDVMPKDYPDTVEELKESCNDMRELSRCYLNYIETCEDDTLNNPEFRTYLNFVIENCQEDSHLYQVISRNLDCFTPTIRSLDKECGEGIIDEKELENLMGGDGVSVEDYEAMLCLKSVWKITCKSQLMEKRCNQEVGDAVLNILRINDFYFANYCLEDVLSKFSVLIQAIEMTASEGKWLEEFNNEETEVLTEF